jgi:uncharacterized protein YrrD
MLKGSDVIGKPIVAFDSGAIVEQVKDVLFDAVNNVVLGFLVKEKGVFSKARIVPFNQVKATGHDAVTVPNQNAVIESSADAKVDEIIQNNQAVKGTRVMTEDGKYLGAIRDLYFNEQTGQVEGYEISGGLMGDALKGRSFLPATSALKVGQDVVFVSHEAVQLLEGQVGGMKGVAQQAGQKLEETKNQGMAKAEMVADKLKNGASNATTSIGTFSDSQLLGKTVAQEVRSDTGTIIAAQGQIITHNSIELAKREGKFMQLVVAAGLAKMGSMGSEAKGIMAQGTQAAQAGMENVSQDAKQTWDKVVNKVSEFKEKTNEKIENRRVQKAIGKPVTKVIYDQRDNIILNTGDLITHEAVKRAKQSNMLDALLDAVSSDKPTFSKEELKA